MLYWVSLSVVFPAIKSIWETSLNQSKYLSIWSYPLILFHFLNVQENWNFLCYHPNQSYFVDWKEISRIWKPNKSLPLHKTLSYVEINVWLIYVKRNLCISKSICALKFSKYELHNIKQYTENFRSSKQSSILQFSLAWLSVWLTIHTWVVVNWRLPLRWNPPKFVCLSFTLPLLTSSISSQLLTLPQPSLPYISLQRWKSEK